MQLTFRSHPVFVCAEPTLSPRAPVHRVHLQYGVIRLSELDGQEILDAGHAGLIAFAPLMRPPQGMASRAWLRHCMHTANARSMAMPAKADYLAGMSLLSGLVYAPETISDIVSKEGMMDLIRESSFARYLTRQGVEQGMEKGIEQGVEQGLRESILAVLETRFDLPASHPLAARIETIDNVQRLNSPLKKSIRAASGPCGRNTAWHSLPESPDSTRSRALSSATMTPASPAERLYQQTVKALLRGGQGIQSGGIRAIVGSGTALISIP